MSNLFVGEGSALLKAEPVIKFKQKDGKGGASSFISIGCDQPNSHKCSLLWFVLS